MGINTLRTRTYNKESVIACRKQGIKTHAVCRPAGWRKCGNLKRIKITTRFAYGNTNPGRPTG